jgi:hypothetical protein
MSHYKMTRLCSTASHPRLTSIPTLRPVALSSLKELRDQQRTLIDLLEKLTESVETSNSDNSSGRFTMSQRFYPCLIGAHLWP